MTETGFRRAATWRKILKAHGQSFLGWLNESGYERQRLELISGELSDFLINTLRQAHSYRSDAVGEFRTRIPEVRACCDDQHV
jgi:hypothetical protein